MPWTLYRYILREVLAILALTAAVLITVLSFFIAIKPMSEGLLDAYALLKFVLYTMPTMLGFALPFAGAFATTLVFIRLSSDNEITACCASGLSYLKILAPVIFLGLVLTASLFYLSNFVVPGYYKKAAKLAEGDLISLMVSRLNQQMPFEMNRFVIYADSARVASPEEIPPIEGDLQPSKMLILNDVAAGQLDRDSRMRGSMTASRATALIYHYQDQSWIDLMLLKVMFYDEGPHRDTGLKFKDTLPLPPQVIPNFFKEKTEFMSYPDLQALKEHPERYTSVGQAMDHLQRVLSAEVLRQTLIAALSDGGSNGVELLGALSQETYTCRAPLVHRVDDAIDLRSNDGRPVVIEYRRGGKLMYHYEAERGVMHVGVGTLSAEPGVYVELTNARVVDPGPDPSVIGHTQLEVPRMSWPGPVLPLDTDPGAASTADQLREISKDPALLAHEEVHRARGRVGTLILDLSLKIASQMNQRGASAVACLLLVTLGALLSIRLKGQMPLVVYFWSFLLAILTLVVINSSSNIVTDHSLGAVKAIAFGLTLMWSGNVLLAVIIGRVYCKIAKN